MKWHNGGIMLGSAIVFGYMAFQHPPESIGRIVGWGFACVLVGMTIVLHELRKWRRM